MSFIRLRVAERLVGILAAVRRSGIRSVVGVVAVGSKGLVGVRGLLGRDASSTCMTVRLVVWGTAGAAARADDPEKGSCQREGSRQPRGCKHVLAHIAIDMVLLELLVQHRRQNGEESSGSGRCSSGEEERNL